MHALCVGVCFGELDTFGTEADTGREEKEGRESRSLHRYALVRLARLLCLTNCCRHVLASVSFWCPVSRKMGISYPHLPYEVLKRVCNVPVSF